MSGLRISGFPPPAAAFSSTPFEYSVPGGDRRDSPARTLSASDGGPEDDWHHGKDDDSDQDEIEIASREHDDARSMSCAASSMLALSLTAVATMRRDVFRSHRHSRLR